MRKRLSRGKMVFIGLVCGVLAGGVVAAAALPATALGGLTVKWAIDSYQNLPDELETPPPAQGSRLYASDGMTLITTFYDENRRNVALTQVAPHMQQAMVAAEDRRFFRHGGVDLRGVVRAFVSNVRGSQNEQGASTLTMQYVRNVRKSDPNLTPQEHIDATANTMRRKLQEMRYAQALEKRMSKQEILERYLNIAYFGAGAYGIEAASQRYFAKPASQLTLAESALIAGLVQSPDHDNPISGDQRAALNRRSYVLESMVRMKAITPDQAAAARSEPLRLTPKRDDAPKGCANVPRQRSDWGFFCDYFVQWWTSQEQFGDTPVKRAANLKRGGYQIITSLDPKVQRTAVSQSLNVYGYGSARVLPIAAVEPGTGRVLALAVNRNYSPAPGTSNTVNQLVAGGGGVNGYQAGSTFKMFTMLAALEAGKPLSTGFNAPTRLKTKYPASGNATCDGRYCPSNANPSWMNGYRNMWTGFGRSVNTYFVWLEEQVGPRKVIEMAKRLGISFRSPSDANLATEQADTWASFTLGVSDTTPLDLANAYATVAAEGIYCKPLPVRSILDADKNPVEVDPDCHRVVDADVARAATDAARCPVGQNSKTSRCDGGTAEGVGAALRRQPLAGKTGSSERNATESFAGFTPSVAAAGTAANPDNPSDAVGEGVSSSVNMAVVRTIAAALEDQPRKGFVPPSPDLR